MVVAAPVPETAFKAAEPILPTLTFLHRFTQDEFQQFVDTGYGGDEGKRVELLDGLILERSIPGSAHQLAMRLLNKHLTPCIPDGWCLDLQASIDLRDSRPQPDGVVYRGDERSFPTGLASPDDIAILIEVSHTSLIMDRREKGWKYAENNIPVYWIINLVDNCIEVYSDPQPFLNPASYATRTVYQPGEQVPVVLDGQSVASIGVSDLLG